MGEKERHRLEGGEGEGRGGGGGGGGEGLAAVDHTVAEPSHIHAQLCLTSNSQVCAVCIQHEVGCCGVVRLCLA